MIVKIYRKLKDYIKEYYGIRYILWCDVVRVLNEVIKDE